MYLPMRASLHIVNILYNNLDSQIKYMCRIILPGFKSKSFYNNRKGRLTRLLIVYLFFQLLVFNFSGLPVTRSIFQ